MIGLSKLKNTITEVVGNGTVLTIQPGGNHGDTLIYKGGIKLFDDIGIDKVGFGKGEIRADSPPVLSLNGAREVYHSFNRILTEIRFIKHKFSGKIDAVYIHGGGNFNEYWRGAILSYQVAVRYFDVPIIIGPQSCHFSQTDPEIFFQDVTNEVHFFCRDEYSYEVMSNVDRIDGVHLYLEDDTALYLSKEDLPIQELSEEYNLISLRFGKESAGVSIDVPIDPPIKAKDISRSENKFADFVNMGARADKIYTDRLHVAILATLLNKRVRFYENVYHKNRGVYENSLKGNEKVEFVYN